MPLEVSRRRAKVATSLAVLTTSGLVVPGAAGALGASSPATEITSSISYAERTTQATTSSSETASNARLTAQTLVRNHDSIDEGFTVGSEVQTVTVTGTDEDAERFRMSYSDVYVASDEAYPSISDAREIVFGLSRHEGVHLASVDVTSQLSDDDDVLTLSGLEQRRHGGWHTVFRRRAARAEPGQMLRLRVTMTDTAGERTRTRLRVPVPRRPGRDPYYVEVTGGSASSSRAAYQNSLRKVLAALRARPRNDQVAARVMTFGDGPDGSTRASPGQAHPVEGYRSAVLVIR